MEKKLTDEEIVKALYICTTADDDMDCSDGCPMYEEDYCTTKLLKMAFDLIQRQQEELDYYKCANRELTSANVMLKKYRKQDAKDTAKEILSMFDDRNYISEKDLKTAIAERYGLGVKCDEQFLFGIY